MRSYAMTDRTIELCQAHGLDLQRVAEIALRHNINPIDLERFVGTVMREKTALAHLERLCDAYANDDFSRLVDTEPEEED